MGSKWRDKEYRRNRLRLGACRAKAQRVKEASGFKVGHYAKHKGGSVGYINGIIIREGIVELAVTRMDLRAIETYWTPADCEPHDNPGSLEGFNRMRDEWKAKCRLSGTPAAKG